MLVRGQYESVLTKVEGIVTADFKILSTQKAVRNTHESVTGLKLILILGTRCQ